MPDLSKKVKIVNEHGLHARAAAEFVKLANQFESDIVVVRESNEVDGKSIMNLLMLGAGCGSEIELRVSGADESQALQELIDLIANGFNE